VTTTRFGGTAFSVAGSSFHLELWPRKRPFCFSQTLFQASSEDPLFFHTYFDMTERETGFISYGSQRLDYHTMEVTHKIDAKQNKTNN